MKLVQSIILVAALFPPTSTPSVQSSVNNPLPWINPSEYEYNPPTPKHDSCENEITWALSLQKTILEIRKKQRGVFQKGNQKAQENIKKILHTHQRMLRMHFDLMQYECHLAPPQNPLSYRYYGI